MWAVHRLVSSCVNPHVEDKQRVGEKRLRGAVSVDSDISTVPGKRHRPPEGQRLGENAAEPADKETFVPFPVSVAESKQHGSSGGSTPAHGTTSVRVDKSIMCFYWGYYPARADT